MERHDISDPTDWLDTRLTEFAPLDAALRCEICKDYYNTPMITSCAHTFCSLCIRRTLAADGKCPTCRSNDQASKLRRNAVIEELVEKFKAARPVALKLAQEERTGPDRSTSGANAGSKRKAADADIEDDEVERSSQKRKTRSQSRRDVSSGPPNITVIDNEEDGDYQPEDDLVACPICNKKMKQEAVFPHLDHCEQEQEQDRRKGARTRTPNSANATPSSPTPQPPSKPPERIAELSYGLLTEKALRKKLSELGIPSWGPRTLLTRRHTEWVNLWNANADSTYPRPKRDILHQLDVWERTQGGNAPNHAGTSSGPNGVMRKDFDGAGWAQSNKTEFDKLIAEARRKPQKQEEGKQDTRSESSGDNATSNNLPEGEKPTSSNTAEDPPKHPTASEPPPYLKHEDSLERAKEKIHGLRRPGDPNSVPQSPAAKRISTEVHGPPLENRRNGASPEELFRAEEQRASISSFSPAPTKGGEKIPMFQLQEHPVKDVDGETTVQ